jgi:hypothetical protein
MRPILEAHPGAVNIIWANTSEAQEYAAQWMDFLGSVKWQIKFRSGIVEQFDPKADAAKGITLEMKDAKNAPPNAVVLDTALKAATIKFGVANGSPLPPEDPLLVVGEKPNDD